MSADDRLTRRQTAAVAALLTCRTLREAAEASGVAEVTLRRWQAQEAFAAAYRQSAREVHREAVSALLSAQREAVDALRAGLADRNPNVRLRSARALLELGVRVSADDFSERLEALEAEVTRWSERRRAGLTVV